MLTETKTRGMGTRIAPGTSTAMLVYRSTAVATLQSYCQKYAVDFIVSLVVLQSVRS
jgi:hypothetical protein